MEPLPKIISCFGVIIESNQIPPRIYLVHNTADPLGPNGEEGKPDGWGLPGGGNLEGEKPDETVRREVLGEAGLFTEIAARGKNSEFGEILFESKPIINNDIYIFFLNRVNNEGLRNKGFRSIEETNETGRVMLADLGSILKMPLAIKVTYQENVVTEKTKNPEGIYFSTRDRIFGVLEYLGYDFYELIPDLDKLFGEIKREEVGNYVYNLLADAVAKKNEIYERRAQRLRPDDDELLERYQQWAVR
ncbi:MAG: NUDIX domain-containing protein [bacterium]|nr:NUDIX domain-containing protein [bacterium]